MPDPTKSTIPTSVLEQLARAAAERGMLVEAGWLSLRIAAYPVETPPEQLTELRAAYLRPPPPGPVWRPAKIPRW